MNPTIRSEITKVRCSRATITLAAAGLIYNALNGVATAALAGRDGSAPLGHASNITNILRGGSIGTWVVLLAAIMSVTSEYLYNTIVPTTLITPRHGRVALAKVTVFAVLGGCYAATGMLVGMIAATPSLLSHHAHLDIVNAVVARNVTRSDQSLRQRSTASQASGSARSAVATKPSPRLVRSSGSAWPRTSSDRSPAGTSPAGSPARAPPPAPVRAGCSRCRPAQSSSPPTQR